MIHGFFDDSGKESDPGNKIVCMAGYLTAGTLYWGAFHEGWSNQLLRFGISWLHMKDFMQEDIGEYVGWRWPKKQAVLEQFIAVIKQSQLTGFGVAVDAEAWREIPKEITKQHGTAQEFCFQRILNMVVKRMKIARPDDHISIMFDCDEAFTPARFRRFLDIKAHYPDAERYLSSFAIADPKRYVALQAADLLAWETRKELLRRSSGHNSRPEFKFIMDGLPEFEQEYESELWTQEEIQDGIIKNFAPVL